MTHEESKKEWHSWPTEMPHSKEKIECPEYEMLNSNDYLRKMLKETRQKVFEMASKEFKNIKNSIILLAGGTDSVFEFYDNDVNVCYFRQEPYFRYLFGINEPNCVGFLDLSKKETVLLVTPMPIESERWLGARRSFDYYKKEYDVNEVGEVEKIHELLQKRSIEYIYLMYGKNTDSGSFTKTLPQFKEMETHYIIDKKSLFPVLSEARVHKTQCEIELIRTACRVTSKAHVHVMRHIQPNMTERQLESLFKAYTSFYGGSRHEAYECICGSGVNGAILHYGHAGYPNDKIIKNGETVVLDLGSEYLGYATDITCSYPVNGKFTDKQKMIHNAVYDAQSSVLKIMKPGVLWTDMHVLAEITLIKHLLKNMKILQYNKKDKQEKNEEEIIEILWKMHVASLFIPHGLGHLLGMNVHDPGGYNLNYQRSSELGLCWLRTSRRLEQGMVITVEPGLYFNEKWIIQMLQKYPSMNEYVNQENLKEYLGMGGCRLEDDVLITKDGIENFTMCPRTCEDIENVMSLAKK